jgi:hypothetical protein
MANQRPSDDEIRTRAYELFLERGGTPGSDLEDWMRAEQELRARMGGGDTTSLLPPRKAAGTSMTMAPAGASGSASGGPGASSKAGATPGKGQDADVSDAPESGTRRDPVSMSSAGAPETGVSGLNAPKGLAADTADAPESGTRRAGNSAPPRAPGSKGGGSGRRASK